MSNVRKRKSRIYLIWKSCFKDTVSSSTAAWGECAPSFETCASHSGNASEVTPANNTSKQAESASAASSEGTRKKRSLDGKDKEAENEEVDGQESSGKSKADSGLEKVRLRRSGVEHHSN